MNDQQLADHMMVSMKNLVCQIAGPILPAVPTKHAGIIIEAFVNGIQYTTQVLKERDGEVDANQMSRAMVIVTQRMGMKYGEKKK